MIRPTRASTAADSTRDGYKPVSATLDRVSKLAAERLAVVACALGLGHATVSAYWAVGGTALLDTIGGSIERWGREREPALIAGLWLIVVVKVIVGLAAPVLTGVGAGLLPSWTSGRVPRILGWIAATVLVLYGGVLTVAGLLAEAGVLEVAPEVDRRALAWHAFLWDPWFLLWGVAFGASLWLTRPGPPAEYRAWGSDGVCI